MDRLRNGSFEDNLVGHWLPTTGGLVGGTRRTSQYQFWFCKLVALDSMLAFSWIGMFCG